MNAARALKLKNRLAGEIARLKSLALAHNAYIEGRLTQPYDVSDIVNNALPRRIVELVAVKTALAVHNTGGRYTKACDHLPVGIIYLLAELKGVIEMLRCMNCSEGSDVDEAQRFRAVTDPLGAGLVRKCWVSQKEVDALVRRFEIDIDKLQDQLDAANATADMPLEDIKL